MDGDDVNRNDSSEGLLTVAEVAKRLHVHPNTVRTWSNQGVLHAYRVGPRRDRRFSVREVDRLLSREARQPDAPKEAG